MLTDVSHQSDAVRFLQRFVDNKLTQPLLLIGESGVGRRFSVEQAIRECFCIQRDPSCGCYDCANLRERVHPDYHLVSSVEDKGIGVEDVRETLARTNEFPASAQFRVIVIDGADTMTVPAANALLKTLEEPPSTVRFFLLAESYDGVLATIRSRCGRVPYKRLPEIFIQRKMADLENDSTKALVLARMAEGSVGRAIKYWGSSKLKLRDQVLALISFGLSKDWSALFATVDEMGKDLSTAMIFLDQILHDLLMLNLSPTQIVNLDVRDQLEAMRNRGTDSLWITCRNHMKLVAVNSSVPINYTFHVKTALLETFFVG